MSIRITSAPTKIAYVTTSYVVGFSATAFVAVTMGMAVASITFCVLVIVAVVFAARTFRGENEATSRRPWWRMTCHPTAGFVFASLFGFQGIYLVASTWSEPQAGVSLSVALVNVLIGAMFTNSSLRLKVATSALPLGQ